MNEQYIEQLIRDYIKKYLKVKITCDWPDITVKLLLNGEVISETTDVHFEVE